MEKKDENKNPHFPTWKTWIIASMTISQILVSVQLYQIRQENQVLWNAVIQQNRDLNRLTERLNHHLNMDILYEILTGHLICCR